MYLDYFKKIDQDNRNFWESEKVFWSNYGKIYHYLEGADPYKDMLREIAKMVSQKNRKKWLDAGCGPGTMIDLILKNQGNVDEIHGIDFDGVMLNQAIERLKKYSFIKIKSANLSENLSEPDNYFDGIIANLVLTYIIIFNKQYVGVDALEMVLKEMYRVLKSEGLFIWTTPVNDVNFFKVFFASWRQLLNPLTPQYAFYGPQILSYALKIQKKGKIGVYHFLNKKDIYNIMVKVGFKNINIDITFAKQAYLISASK